MKRFEAQSNIQELRSGGVVVRRKIKPIIEPKNELKKTHLTVVFEANDDRSMNTLWAKLIANNKEFIPGVNIVVLGKGDQTEELCHYIDNCKCGLEFKKFE